MTVHMSQGMVTLQGVPPKNVENFKYLGTAVNLTHNQKLQQASKGGGQGGWPSWKRATGILCDKRVSANLKGRVYKAVVRPSLPCGAKTWSTTKAISRRVEVNEMRMLRWRGDVTLHDKIQNELIRRTFCVKDPASSKVVERRLNLSDI